jgi:hypothetical protein
MNVGFNQAWLKNNFGHQWTSPSYDQNEVNRMFDLAQKARSKTVRIWLFEGIDSTALIWKDGKVVGLHPDFIKNFEAFLKEAKKRNLNIYPTLFTPEPLKDTNVKEIRDRWWNLYNNKFNSMDSFKENALVPLMKIIQQESTSNVVNAIDVANEIDSGVIFNKFEGGWAGANKFICSLRSVISPIPVTASVGWGRNYLKGYEGAENTILKPNPSQDCVDFWDIHIYRDNGEIKNCEEIKLLAEKYQKKIILGEFGQTANRFDDELQKKNTESFIKNAKKCGFSMALAWRLSDVRIGHNPEAKFSYESLVLNQTRPAFDIIRNHNMTEALCLKSTIECSVDPNKSNALQSTHINNSKQPKENLSDDSINSQNKFKISK